MPLAAIVPKPRTPVAVRRSGSHFLARESTWVRRLVDAAALKPGETALDAGAGAGSITSALAEAVAPGGSVLAVETDADAAAAVRRLQLPGVKVVEGDVLKVRLPERLDAVVANPPFRIVPALLRRLLDHGMGRAVLVVPRELSARLSAETGSEGYGRLTVEVGLRAKAKVLFPMPRKAFDPPPAVECAALSIVPRPHAPVPPLLDLVLDAAWAAKRRTLRHSLAPLAARLDLPPQAVSAALAATGAAARPAVEVSPWEFGQVALRLGEAAAPQGP